MFKFIILLNATIQTVTMPVSDHLISGIDYEFASNLIQETHPGAMLVSVEHDDGTPVL